MKHIYLAVVLFSSAFPAKAQTVVPPVIVPTAFIPKDSGNKMVQHYLNSVNYPANDTALRAIVLSADQLRLLLRDTSVKDIKIMLAHTLSSINEGVVYPNEPYHNAVLTLVGAGINADGDYVYFEQTNVINKGLPCPNNCPSGTAANPLFN